MGSAIHGPMPVPKLLSREFLETYSDRTSPWHPEAEFYTNIYESVHTEKLKERFVVVWKITHLTNLVPLSNVRKS